MSVAPITIVHLSRERGDCAIASLAMLTGASYENVLRAVARRYPDHQAGTGLHHRRIMRVAAADLNTPLRRVVEFDPDSIHGILLIPHHACLIRSGLVIEADGTGAVWAYDDYVAHRNGKRRIRGVSVLVASEE